MTRVTVTVDQHSNDALRAVVSRLKTAGMRVDQVLDSLGIITGSVAAARCPSLRSLEGVVAVEPDQPVKIRSASR